MTDYKSLPEAFAAFQANLPRIRKTAAGQVAGNRNYKYADLADVTHEVLPELAKYGLSWLTMPTLNDAGQFVLRYKLLHTSGEFETGDYELPTGAAPQQLGSAITYGRRYTLTSVTGVVADEDDDGRAAQDAPRRTAPRQQQAPAPTEQVDQAAQARQRLAATCTENHWDLSRVAARFATEHGGALREATDAAVIDRFRESLFALPDAELKAPLKAPATNGAQA
jgi:hypothetical protein